jgi:hypothetical protein
MGGKHLALPSDYSGTPPSGSRCGQAEVFGVDLNASPTPLVE